jgi:hypothetical protein
VLLVLLHRLRADLLLGVATVSLSALLQECWVDGYAPVYAMMARADGAEERQEQVQVRSRIATMTLLTPAAKKRRVVALARSPSQLLCSRSCHQL